MEQYTYSSTPGTAASLYISTLDNITNTPRRSRTCIWDVDLAEPGLVIAEPALKGLFAQIGNGNHAALIAHVNAVWVTIGIQSVPQEIRRTYSHTGMRKQKAPEQDRLLTV